MNKINLSQLKSCNQIWSDMPKNDIGRLCIKCQNTIVDFRNKSDSEIAKTHMFSENKVCGLYNKTQVQSLKKRNNVKKVNRWTAIYIGLFSLLSFKSFGQNEKVNEIKTEQTEKKFENNDQKRIDTESRTQNRIQKDSIYISGTLLDEENIPVPGASVIIKGTSIGSLSDFDGNYSLNVTQPLDSLGEITLQYSYVGYETVEKKVDLEFFKKNKNKKIDINFNVNAELTVFYVTYKIPLHKRIWNGIKSIFKKKK